jgi:tetratricopeptide (TPR) repeat protein
MALRGDLASVDLAQVFQMLALNKKVGLLSIQSAKLWKVLYFDQRGVTVYHNVHQVLDRVVAAFVRAGRLTEQVVDEVRDHAARTGQGLADSLLAGGYVEPTELEEQYRVELEEEVYDLFFCREAKFEFHERATTLEGRDGTIDERFFSNCDSVIMEAARRIDEWAYISERVPTTAEVLVAVAETIDAEQYGPDSGAVFGLLDGRRNVARVVETTGLSNFQVCKILSQLLDAGAIAPVAAEELLPLAAECMAENRLQDAISLYERAIEQQVGLPEAHSHAAKAYRAAEQYEHAVYHLECEAEARLEAGDRAGAAQRLDEVRQLLPTSLQARERLVELTLGQGAVSVAGFDALAEGKELVDLFVEYGDVQRVRGLLERLLQVQPHDPDLKKSLVNVHLKAGDQKRVAELYESIADDLVRQQKPLEAVAYLQKILLIDRGRHDISERVRRLYEFDERSRRRGRALGILAVTFCLLLVLGSAFWFYNQRAEEDFARIDVKELVLREDFAGAIAAYDEFIAHHPLTTAVPKARAELQQIEASRQQFEARRDSERATRDRELKRLRDEYKAAWKQHRELFLQGEPERSLEVATQARELVAKAGTPEDAQWSLQEGVETTWTKLRDFLAQAERLGVEYRQKVQAEDWPAARTIALQLQNQFEMTRVARSSPLPVTIVTRPAGAALAAGGKPLHRTVDGETRPTTTPAVVLCAPAPTAVVATLPGFEPASFVVDARAQAQVEVVLEIVPERRIGFEAPLQTGAGIGEGWLAVGLRGGRLGLARTDGTARAVRELPGLRAVDSTPRVQNGRVFFTTNDNTVECVGVDPSVTISGWPVTLSSPVATEIAVAEGRVALVDREGVLHCWEQATARPVFAVSLDSGPSGAPTIERRQVHVGTADGRILVFDASDGSVVAALRCPAGVCTRVLSDRGTLWFGGTDGNVRAVDMDGRVRFTVAVGRSLGEADLVLTRNALLVIAGGNQLRALDRATGDELGRLVLDGEVQPGLRVRGAHALLQVRRPKTRKDPTRDVLLAVDVATMNVAWEYVDSGVRPGQPCTDELMIALPSAAGEVVLFR